jgi:hypothetical protein
MHESFPEQNAYEILGIDPEAEFLEVERAYHWMKDLYGPDSLAVYSLLDDGQKKLRLERIEEAYRDIARNRRIRMLPPAALAVKETETVLPSEDDVSPGALLRRARVQAGLSLREVAERTKVSPMKLDYIESERIELLPAPVYLRGFVAEFAKTLGLSNPGGFARLYLEKCSMAVTEA